MPFVPVVLRRFRLIFPKHDVDRTRQDVDMDARTLIASTLAGLQHPFDFRLADGSALGHAFV